MVNRFKAPQANYFEQACKELRMGAKQATGYGIYSHRLKGLDTATTQTTMALPE